ncbi:MAG TPA: hypothetical protein ENJ80_03160 [Gammaproteobacteria bacterium]|nr:hypothetical protein [Gammaproteobacteria bacterium]
MNTKTFLRIMLPVWIIAIIPGALHYTRDPGGINTLDTAFLITLIALLPFVAGFFLVRAGGGIGIAMAGAASISLVNLLTVGPGYFTMTASLLVFGGFIIDVLLFSAVPQAICGAIGGFTARMFHSRHGI